MRKSIFKIKKLFHWNRVYNLERWMLISPLLIKQKT